MIRFILLMAAFHVVASAADPYIDLSGDWRRSPDDRPEYADPAFDDSGWKVMRLPRDVADGPTDIDLYWLRRTVQLPQDIETSDLALTIGPVREVYELYVNGTRIGATGPFFDDRKAQIAYTRVFRVPPSLLRGARMVVAIRTRHVNFGSRSTGTSRGGSFLLSTAAQAPFNEAKMMTDAQWIRYSPQGLFAVMLFCLAFLAFVLWLAERERHDLFWLTLLLVFRGAAGILLFSDISMGMFPLAEFGPGPVQHWLLGPGVFIALVELAFTISIRKAPFQLRAAVWILVLALSFLNQTQALAFVGDALVLAIVAFGWLRGGGIRQPWSHTATASIVALLAVVQMEALGGFTFLHIPRVLPTWYMLGSFEVSTLSSTYFVLGALLSLLSLRRLIADRVEKQRLSGEIEAARVVQQLLLREPDSALIDAAYRPAAEVGGDFWQAYALEDGGHLLAVGDVSGKGLKAAMVVALVTGALCNRHSDEPREVLAELGRAVSGRLDGGFVTACAARFGPDGCARIANAGHLPPYLDGEEVECDSGLPLGVSPDATYDSRELRLAPGQQLTFVSDGVVEAANSKGELFGFDRTAAISTKSAQEIAEAARVWGQNDDITVVTVRRANK